MIWWIPLIGAAIGALAYEDDPWTGALIGAGIGMTGGAAAGAMGAGAVGGGAAAGAAGTAGAGMGLSGAGLAAGTGTGITAGAGMGLSGAGLAAGTGTGITAGAGAGFGLAAGGTLGSIAAPAAAGAGYGLLAPAAASGAGFMAQAKPWLQAGASMAQQSGLLDPQPQGGPQHHQMPNYGGGGGLGEIGNSIMSQGGDMLQANAMERERNKQQRAALNPFAFGRY